MKLAIQINGHPASSQAATTAYQFIKAALSKNHEVILVFFYFDGVYSAWMDRLPSTEEWLDVPRWSELATSHGLDLVVCSAAAERRGIALSKWTASGGDSLLPSAKGFRLGGLSQWVDACMRSERFISFAA